MDLRVQFPDPRHYERLVDWAIELNAVLTRMLTTTPEDQYPIVGLADVKIGANGGSSVAGLNIRTLNTEYDPVDICILGANSSFALVKGRYMVQASCPANAVGQHQALLRNVSSNEIAIYGTVEYAPPASSQTRSWVVGVIEPKEVTAYRIEHYCTAAIASNGLGVVCGQLGQDVYTQVAIWGLA